MIKLINYEVFRQRKKFDPLILFKKNPNLTYNDFKEFLNNRLVEAPDVSYYKRVKKAFEKTQNENNVITENVSDELVDINNIINEETLENKTEENPSVSPSLNTKQNKRRKRKSNDTN